MYYYFYTSLSVDNMT